MSEVFSKGTKVRIGSEFTQSFETMGKVFEVQTLVEADEYFGPKYRVTSDDGREWEFRAALLERVEEPDLEEKVVEVLKELLDDTLVCTRDWLAWSYGTMTEADFEALTEQDELLSEVAQAVIKAVKG